LKYLVLITVVDSLRPCTILCEQFDADMAQRASVAEANGQVIRYIGSVDVAAGKASVELTRWG